MLCIVEKNSKWIDMIDIGTHETPINVFVFLLNGICKHAAKSVKTVISNPECRRFTSAALPKRIQVKLPFFKFYFLLQTGACQFIKKVSVEDTL